MISITFYPVVAFCVLFVLWDLKFVEVPAKVNWEDNIPKDSFEWEWQTAVSKLFDERPIWPRWSLLERLLDDGVGVSYNQLRRSARPHIFRFGISSLLKKEGKYSFIIELTQIYFFYKVSHSLLTHYFWFRLLPRSGYYFSTGPFGQFWIRKGYDPRIDPESRMWECSSNFFFVYLVLSLQWSKYQNLLYNSPNYIIKEGRNDNILVFIFFSYCSIGSCHRHCLVIAHILWSYIYIYIQLSSWKSDPLSVPE